MTVNETNVQEVVDTNVEVEELINNPLLEQFILMVDEYPATRLKADSQKFLADVDNEEAFQAIAEVMRDEPDNDMVLSDYLWSLVRYNTDEYRSIQELIESSVYAEQFSVLPEAVNSILCDKFSGLSQVGYFISPLEIIISAQGNEKLSGGHHRLFLNAYLMRSLGGADWDDILRQQLPVFVAEINKKAIDAKDKMARAIELESVLWMASNGSRKPTPIEKNAFKFSKQGVRLDDIDSILENSTLKPVQRFELLFVAECRRQGVTPDRNGVINRQLVIDPQAETEEEKFWAAPAQNTLAEMAKSFYNNLIKKPVEGWVAPEKGRKKAPSKWEPTLERYPLELIREILEVDKRTSTSLLEDALIGGIAQDSDLRNIARAKSKHGVNLATLVDETIEPRVKVKLQEATSSVKGKSRKTALSRRFS